MRAEQVTITLGDEYDEALREALQTVLLKHKAASVEKSWAVAGSQEVEQLGVRIGDDLIRIESETYIGLTVSGPRSLVDKIAEEVRVELASRRN